MMWKLLICISFLSAAASTNMGTSKEHLNLVLANFSQKYHENIISALNNVTAKQQVAVINDYVDELLEELNNFITLQTLDPVEMPDIEKDFIWNAFLASFSGHMHLTKGWLQGLGTMKRNKDVKVWYEYPNIKILLPLGYDVLMFDYEYKAKFMKVGPTGNVDGKTSNCKFTIELDLNMVTLQAKLKDFTLNTVGKISLKFSGQKLTDWMANIFVIVTIPFVKPILNIVVQSFVGNLLFTVIDFYNGVICNILGNC